MINAENILLKLVAELPISEFDKAVEKASLSDSEVKLILDIIEERGV